MGYVFIVGFKLTCSSLPWLLLKAYFPNSSGNNMNRPWRKKKSQSQHQLQSSVFQTFFCFSGRITSWETHKGHLSFIQCLQKYKRASGDKAEQEQVNKTRTPSPSNGDAILDSSPPQHAMYSGYQSDSTGYPICIREVRSGSRIYPLQYFVYFPLLHP